MSKDALRNNSKNDGETMPPKSLDALRTKRRKGVVVARVVASALVGAGLGANFLDHKTGVVAEGEVKPGSSTEAEITDVQLTSDILTARGDFKTTADAELDVKMKVKPPKYLGGLGAKVGDKMMFDYTQEQDINCYGELQQIVPSDAIEKDIDGDNVNLTIDMSQVEINDYCDYVESDVDPSTKKSLNEPYVIMSDILRKLKGDVPKPDKIMNDVSDNAKNALTAKSLESMRETCGPELEDLFEQAAIDGVRKAVVNTSGINEKDLHVGVSYENGKTQWHKEEDGRIAKIKADNLEAEANIKDFDFDKEATCDTTKLKVVGEAVE